MCRPSWHVNVVFLHIKSTRWNGKTHVQHQVTSQSPWRLLWSHGEKLTEFCWIERKSLHLKTLNSFECLAPLKHVWVLSLSWSHLDLPSIENSLICFCCSCPVLWRWICWSVLQINVVAFADGKHLTTPARSANVAWWPVVVSMFIRWNAWLYCATWLNLLQWHFTIL